MTLVFLFLGCHPTTPGDPISACPSGQLTDGDRCVPEACGAGTWGQLEIPDEALFVLAGADGGDGSEDAPFGDLYDALDAVRDDPGPTILLGEGVYPGPFELTRDFRDVALHGRCPSLTVLEGDGSSPTLEVWLPQPGQDAALRGLTVRGGLIGVDVNIGTVTLEDVVLSQNAGAALRCYGYANVNAENLLVSETLDTPLDEGWESYDVLSLEGCDLNLTQTELQGAPRVGLWVEYGRATLRNVNIGPTRADSVNTLTGMGFFFGEAEVDAEGLRVEGATQLGGAIFGGVVSLSNSAVGAPGRRDDGAPAGGVQINNAIFSASNLEISDCSTWGIYAQDSALWLDEVRVLDTAPNVNGMGRGLELVRVSMHADALEAHRNARQGLYALDSELVLARSAFNDNLPSTDLRFGEGIYLDGGAFTATDLTLNGNTSSGLMAVNGLVTLDRATIRDTLPDGEGRFGYGIDLQQNAQLWARELRISDSMAAGLYISGARAELRDVAITATQPGAIGFARGVVVRNGSSFTADDLRLTDNAEMGMSVYASEARVTNLEVLRTSGGDQPVGVGVDGQATVTGENWRIDETSGIGLLAEDAALTLTGWTIHGTARSPEHTSGIGLIAQEGATLALRDGALTDNDGPGMMLSGTPVVACTGCQITNNRFAGVGLQDASTLTLGPGSVVQDNLAHANEGGGYGVWASGEYRPNNLTLSGVTMEGHPLAGVYFNGAGTLHIEDSALHGSAGAGLTTRPDGQAVMVVGSQDATLTGSTLQGSGREAALVHGAAVRFSDNRWIDNAVDLHWQGCTTLYPDELPTTESWVNVILCPEFDLTINELHYQLTAEVPVVDGDRSTE